MTALWHAEARCRRVPYAYPTMPRAVLGVLLQRLHKDANANTDHADDGDSNGNGDADAHDDDDVGAVGPQR